MDQNSSTWVKKQQGYVAWWADQLKGRDLRKLTLLDDILPALERYGRKSQADAATIKLEALFPQPVEAAPGAQHLL